MVRGNLGAAMQGLAAIPLLVGYDIDHDSPDERGRIFSFDVAGDRHEEFGGYQAIGSGSVFAKSSLKKLYRPDLDEASALAIAVEALYDAADDDSATGGPDLVRRIFLTAAVVDASGSREVASSEIEAAAHAVADRRAEAHEGMRDDFSVLRQCRTDHARSFGVGPQGYRAWAQRRGLTYADGVLFVAENPSNTLRKVSEIYDRIGFAAVGKYNEFESLRKAGIQLADMRGVQLRQSGCVRVVAGQRIRQHAGFGVHRAARAVRGGAVWPR